MLVDFGKFQICPETIQTIGEILQDEFLTAPGFEEIHTIYQGIVTKSTLGFWQEPGLVGVKRQDCDPVPQEWGIPVRKTYWDPKPWEILLAECFANLENSIAVYALQLGKEIADLTQTEWATIISEKLIEAMQKFFWRLFWFNDEDIANVADGGILSDSYEDDLGNVVPLEVRYFDILDGFWKQFEQLAADRPAQYVHIDANDGATYAAQVISPEDAADVLQNLWFQNDGRPVNHNLRGASDKMLLVTQNIYDAFNIFLLNGGKCCVQTLDYYINGVPVIAYNGVPLIPMPIWDEMIYMFFNDGTKLYNPNRALLTTKSNLGVGVDKLAAFEEFNMWYERKERRTYIEAMGKADAKVLNPRMFRLAM